MGSEIPEVIVIVENEKTLLVVAGTENVLRQTRAAADHLKELDFGAHCFEKDQVERVGNIDSGIEHIDAHGNLGKLISLSE